MILLATSGKLFHDVCGSAEVMRRSLAVIEYYDEAHARVAAQEMHCCKPVYRLEALAYSRCPACS